MDITQVVEIPVNRKLTIDVPLGVPVGPIVIAYKPVLPTKRGTPKSDCLKGQTWISDGFDAPLALAEDTATYEPKTGSRGEEDDIKELAGSWKGDKDKKWEIFMRGVNGFSDDFMADGRLQGTDQEREWM